MSLGNLYTSCEKGEPVRTRAVLPNSLVKYFKLDIKISDPDSHFPSEFTSGRVPAFRYPCGQTLTESVPVCLRLVDYIPNKGGLLGDESAAQYCEILQWMQIFNIELMDAVAVCFTMYIGRVPYNADAFDYNWACVERQLSIINDHLTKNTYLVGESVSLADLYGVPMLMRGAGFLWDAEYRSKFPAVFRWFETVKVSPVYGGFFDDFKYAVEFKHPK